MTCVPKISSLDSLTIWQEKVVSFHIFAVLMEWRLRQSQCAPQGNVPVAHVQQMSWTTLQMIILVDRHRRCMKRCQKPEKLCLTRMETSSVDAKSRLIIHDLVTSYLMTYVMSHLMSHSVFVVWNSACCWQVLQVERELKHKIRPQNAFHKCVDFDFIMSCPKEDLHQLFIGLYGEHIIPASFYQYTQVCVGLIWWLGR